jgi:hypothetical protein
MVKNRIIGAFQVCGQHINPAHPHGVDSRLLDGGWERYIEEVIEPELEWLSLSGPPRILLHCPFSAKPGDYQIDQYINAQNAKLPTVVDWEKWGRWLTMRAEVICYIGTIHNDPDFAKRRVPGAFKGDDYLRRMEQSIGPILNVGGSPGADWANDWPDKSVESEMLEVLRALAKDNPPAEMYLEPIPNINCPHLFDWPSIITEQLWRVRSLSWAAPIDRLKGEIIRWPMVPDGGWGGTNEAVGARLDTHLRNIVSEGHTFCGATGRLRVAGYAYPRKG